MRRGSPLVVARGKTNLQRGTRSQMTIFDRKVAFTDISSDDVEALEELFKKDSDSD